MAGKTKCIRDAGISELIVAIKGVNLYGAILSFQGRSRKLDYYLSSEDTV